MSLKSLCFSCSLCVVTVVCGQNQRFRARFELGGMGGSSYYIGDLNPSRHFANSHLALGGILRYNLSTRASLRLTATYGRVSGDDAQSNDPDQINRNLSFASNLYEVALGVEVDWFRYRINDMRYPISPYFFYGIGYTRMNPKTSYNGSEVALQPLGTEGQGTALSASSKYRLHQVVIPLGIGVKVNLRERVALSVEYGIRKLFTDYLDDVSGNYVNAANLAAERGSVAAALSDRSLDGQASAGFNRGNPNNKDWYAFYGVMLTFKPLKRTVCYFNGSL